jgi:pyruvate dehydrogenase E1 component
MTTFAHDPDPQETQEWRDALAGVIAHEGPERAAQLLSGLASDAQRAGVPFSSGAGGSIVTPYVNTILASDEPAYPGDIELERKIEAAIRWNAMALVVRANKVSSELGGHVASFASAATLYEVAFNHFFRAAGPDRGGDLVFFQGHSSPGFYARAFMEGRLDQTRMDLFRQEVGGNGLSSYPHPWLMPDFWQFPTVSMGLSPIMSIYQARFMKYLNNRELIDAGDRNVWAFLGDGEMDEPESLGQITIAAREGLDNLKWVVNCNLQRLDGPVRGNGKIIQELEGVFRGAGWNVIKVVWGSNWDPLFASDSSGKLLQLVDETVDGNYQSLRAGGASAVRDTFFGKYPETAALVAGWDDARINALRRGGHDPKKVYAAYARAMERNGKPTVILAKTIKGFGMGSSGEGQNVAHQAKKMRDVDLRNMRDAFGLPIPDADLATVPFYKPDEKSPEMQYFRERLAKHGSLPKRRRKSTSLAVPELTAFHSQLEATGERHISTTMAFVRVLSVLLKDKTLGKHIVPIVADESRTFGMEGLFRQLGIYSHVGQNYTPQDADQLMWYREDKQGQILQEGIDEAGATSSWIAAGTSYSNHDVPMIPFYIYYSMFGFQRIGDLAWAAGDMRTRGFLIGGTSGRTTLNGEGLQHEDGQSHIMASFIPNCVSYDPTYSYELAVIIRDGLRRMVADQEDVYYYITVMNENYEHPAMPEGSEECILRGMHLIRDGGKDKKAPRVQLLGSGSILREVEAAADLLRDDFGVNADVWSATSFNELRRDGIDTERWNLLHPTEKARVPYVAQCLLGRAGPAVAATDYIRTYADVIRPYLDRRYVALGTDGFGRSDFRAKLRTFFEVDRHYVAIAALKALADDGEIPASKVAEAIVKYGIDPNKPNPVTV